MTATAEIFLIAIFISLACSLSGSVLVLKQMVMLSDGMTHTILLGIVLTYFCVKDLNSPFLVTGAAGMGLLTAYFVQILTNTKLLAEDSALAVVFPFLFSIAVILITKYAGNTHIDKDTVLLGELAFAPFQRLYFLGKDIGPKGLYSSGVILLGNICFLTLFYKEIKLCIFDPVLAKILGISVELLHYIFITLVSLTIVVAFEAIGSVLVIAFMVGPASTAYLLSSSLWKMLLLSNIFAVVSAVFGVQGAIYFDVSIAGSVSVTIGIIFGLSFLFCQKKDIRQKKNIP